MKTKSQAARAKWAGLIAEQAGSGLSVPRFCAGRSIAAASMFSWRRKLALEACAAQGAAGGFVEARVLGEGGGVGCGGGVMIDLAGGRRVTVARGFDPRLLLEVLGALESTEPSLAVTGQRRRERRAPGAPS